MTKQTIQAAARMAMRTISATQSPVSASNGNWNAAPNGVQEAMAEAALQVSALKPKATPELTRMFGSWQITTNSSTTTR